MDHFTQSELNHLFMALLLHTKTTRAEQAAWVEERLAIWRKIVTASGARPSAMTEYKTKLFESPDLLKTFLQSPEEIERVLIGPPLKSKAKKAGK
jgi:hypothetical protein